MSKVIITRKIEVSINEPDLKKKKEMYAKLLRWRDIIRKAANIVVSHKCIQRNMADFEYLSDTSKGKVFVSDILKKGEGCSEQNIMYRKLVELFGDQIPHGILGSLNNNISSTFSKTYHLVSSGESALRTYKNSIPIPFPASAIRKIERYPDVDTKKPEYFTFQIQDIPFKTYFGKDRSNNGILLDRCFSDKEEYADFKLKSSSIVIDKRDGETKIFLLACISQPQDIGKTDPNKFMYAKLSVNIPIIYSSNPEALPYMEEFSMFEQRQNLMELAGQIKEFDKALGDKTQKEIEDIYNKKKGRYPRISTIGDREEFLHRRIEIQRAVRRCQKNNRYNKGGKGRERKCQAIERWHKIENNYISTKLHTYANLLVQAARKEKCSKIILCKQESQEIEVKADHRNSHSYLLRNWSYYGLKEKIEYKANKLGITVVVEQAPTTLVTYFDNDDENGGYKLIKNLCKKISAEKFKVTSKDVKIQNIEKFNIIYVGMTGFDASNSELIENFISKNIEPSQMIVPFICKEECNESSVKEIQTILSSLRWWKDIINLQKLTDVDIKSLQKDISKSVDM